MTKITYRNLRKSDLPAFTEFVEMHFPAEKNKIKWWLGKPSLCLVAVFGKEIIGFILVTEYSVGNTIELIAVDKEHQRQKIGTNLVKEAVRKYETDMVWTVSFSTHAGRDLFKSLLTEEPATEGVTAFNGRDIITKGDKNEL